MNLLFRFFQRVFILAVHLGVWWFLITQILTRLSVEVPFLFAVLFAYLFSAYFLVPRFIHLLIFLFRRNRIPRYTHAADGVLADPVNLVFFGTQAQLISAFRQAEWHLAERVTLKSIGKMAGAFLLNRPYAHAPFSSLYLFARHQDFGFQKMIGDSPRKRHHVRFWATNISEDIDIFSVRFWLKKRHVDHTRPVMWIGAATKDIGVGFARLTYQITHRVDRAVDEEREFVIDSLLAARAITDIKRIDAHLPVIGSYISDGQIATAWLKPASPRAGEDRASGR